MAPGLFGGVLLESESAYYRRQPSGNGGGVVMLRYWQVILILMVQLLSLGAAYGRITANQDNMREEMQRRFTVLERASARAVPSDDFNVWRAEFQQDLRDLRETIIRSNLGIK